MLYSNANFNLIKKCQFFIIFYEDLVIAFWTNRLAFLLKINTTKLIYDFILKNLFLKLNLFFYGFIDEFKFKGHLP